MLTGPGLVVGNTALLPFLAGGKLILPFHPLMLPLVLAGNVNIMSSEVVRSTSIDAAKTSAVNNHWTGLLDWTTGLISFKFIVVV